jgi:hypothetical protein
MNLKLMGVALTITGALTHAQTNPPAKSEFEVPSIKPTPPNAQGGGYRFEPGGRAIVTGLTLQNMIQIAGRLQAYQIGGAPWLDSERYNIEAKRKVIQAIANLGSCSSRFLWIASVWCCIAKQKNFRFMLLSRQGAAPTSVQARHDQGG